MITPKTMGQTKTIGELEAESLDGFRNPTRKPVEQADKLKTMAELEAESLDGFRNPIRKPSEQAEIDRRTKAMREHDLKHTATESEEPEDDDHDYGDYHPYGDPQI